MSSLKAAILDAVDSGLNAFAHAERGPAAAEMLLTASAEFSEKQFSLGYRLIDVFEYNKASGMYAILGLAYGCETGVEAAIEEISEGLTDSEIASVFRWWVIYAMSSIMIKLIEDHKEPNWDLSSVGSGRN